MERPVVLTHVREQRRSGEGREEETWSLVVPDVYTCGGWSMIMEPFMPCRRRYV